MKILIPYILSSDIVDEYRIWLNTVDARDLAFFRRIAAVDRRVVLVEPPEYPVAGNQSIGQFFRHCTERDTVYIRMDDDIVFLSPDFFGRFIRFRLDNPDYFMVAPFIVNNALCSFILQERLGHRSEYGPVTPYAFDPVGWNAAKFAHHLHNRFFHQFEIGRLAAWQFERQEMALARFSINCISWLGQEFAKFAGRVPREADEEAWLSAQKPTSIGSTNCIFGGVLACHYAFYTQRDYLDTTDILERYDDLCLNQVGADAVRLSGESLGSTRRFDRFSFDPQRAAKPDATLRERLQTSRQWRYSRSDGQVVCAALTLSPDGSISGYSHPNESRWALMDGHLCFVAADGQISTRFHRIDFDAKGQLRAAGPYLFNAADFEHVLTEVTP